MISFSRHAGRSAARPPRGRPSCRRRDRSGCRTADSAWPFGRRAQRGEESGRVSAPSGYRFERRQNVALGQIGQRVTAAGALEVLEIEGLMADGQSKEFHEAPKRGWMEPDGKQHSSARQDWSGSAWRIVLVWAQRSSTASTLLPKRLPSGSPDHRWVTTRSVRRFSRRPSSVSLLAIGRAGRARSLRCARHRRRRPPATPSPPPSGAATDRGSGRPCRRCR